MTTPQPEIWRMAEERRRQFDASALAYDRYRPRYPEELFDALVRLAALSPGDRVLEVGAGSGIATIPLVERGLSVIALEPAPAMAAMAEAKLAGRGKVMRTRLEDYQAGTAVRMVVAFNAWHWVEPAAGLAKLQELLAPAGSLSIVWSRVVQWGQEPFESRMAELVGWRPGGATEHLPGYLEQLKSSGCFEDFAAHTFRFSRDLDAESYIALTRTYGGTNPEWEDAVRRVIDNELSGTATKVEDAVLYYTRLRS